MTLTAVSLFAGVGGFDLALQRAGIHVTAAVEIDPDARGVLRDRFPHTHLHRDVTEITSDQLTGNGFNPEHGIITAGFPCQDISVAGNRTGLAGQRSGLFWHIIRLVDATKPRWVLLENVAGLLSSNDGRDMGTVVGALADCGYGYAYRVLDSQHAGVPQRRRRVFVAAHSRDWDAPRNVLIDPPRGGVHLATCGHPEPDANPGTSRRTTKESRRTTTGRVVVTALAASFGAGGPDPAHAQAGWIVPGPYGPRRLTPVECERLQGFPDGWTASSNRHLQTDGARYRQLGNAVTVPVVEQIARRIADHHDGNP